MPHGKSPGKSVKRASAYEALRRQGHSKASAAAISNAGRTKAGRKRMAHKAASTRASGRAPLHRTSSGAVRRSPNRR